MFTTKFLNIKLTVQIDINASPQPSQPPSLFSKLSEIRDCNNLILRQKAYVLGDYEKHMNEKYKALWNLLIEVHLIILIFISSLTTTFVSYHDFMRLLLRIDWVTTAVKMPYSYQDPRLICCAFCLLKVAQKCDIL